MDAEEIPLVVKAGDGATVEVIVRQNSSVADIIELVAAETGEQPTLVHDGWRLHPSQRVSCLALVSGSELSVAPSFKVGQKLEAVRRDAREQVGVATIQKIEETPIGRHLSVRFDGTTSQTWYNEADSEIAPCGTCEMLNYQLQPPQGEQWYGWAAYLERCGAKAAPREAFLADEFFAGVYPAGGYLEQAPSSDYRALPPPTASAASDAHHRRQAILDLLARKKKPRADDATDFEIGMKIEAKNQKTELVCAATVAATQPPEKPHDWQRILVHFDGHDPDEYDYWCSADTPDVAPPGSCRAQGRLLHPPRGMREDTFQWDEYIRLYGGERSPASCFARATGFWSD
eukprot:TRINITY_DN47801_c0_g1_i1.p1 TRINITY_DN47801_c0_g1~~TRINITY_DN47801_c0_g1_i1.p1  ORF type:complete len:345 (+),score=77.59 TRINITY_DN47801_c0_g1_i1:76-1110(+)